jgi:hypothetical protein
MTRRILRFAALIASLGVGFSAHGQEKHSTPPQRVRPRLEIKGDYLGETLAAYKANHPKVECDAHKNWVNCSTDATVAGLDVNEDESFAEFEAKRGDVPRLVNLVYWIHSGDYANDLLVKLLKAKFGPPTASFSEPKPHPRHYSEWRFGPSELSVNSLPDIPLTTLGLSLDRDAAKDI